MTTNTTTTSKKAIFSMGLPGSGKSYTLNNMYDLSGFTVIDPDEIKKEKSDYDPKNPAVYHEWSKEQAKIRMNRAIEEGRNLVIDGTGTNDSKMLRQIVNLQQEGYVVELVYVKVRLETAIHRNNKRERTVPIDIILEKYGMIDKAVAVLSKEVDIFKVVNND